MRRRSLLRTVGVVAGSGLAGCGCAGAADCRNDTRFLTVDPEPVDRAKTTSPTGGDDPENSGAVTSRSPAATDGRPSTTGGDRWDSGGGEQWKLRLDIEAEYVRTDRGTFDAVSIAIHGDDGREITTVFVGPVTVDNGFERTHKEMDGGCCPAGELERYYGRTETVAVDRFPRHVLASARNCRDVDLFSVSTFEDGSYYDRRYGCGETPWVFED